MCFDVWLEIFDYFEAIELFVTFAGVTNAADELLLKNNNHFYSRGLVLDADLKYLPDRIPLARVISLTLHQECSFQPVNQFSKLRSLKLIGMAKWISYIIKGIAYREIKLEQLIAVTPKIESLSEFLSMISSIVYLRRLEICVDQLEKKDVINKLALVPSQIEQFILNSSSTIDCSSLFYVLSHFSNIRFLDIALIDRHQKMIPFFVAQNLRTLSLSLLEVPFVWIVHLLEMLNTVIKLKLTGLVHDEDFIINEKWCHLFKLAPFLARIFVNVSLEQDKGFDYYERARTQLRILNLELTCNDDTDDGYLYYGNKNRWWSLQGAIIKSQLLMKC